MFRNAAQLSFRISTFAKIEMSVKMHSENQNGSEVEPDLREEVGRRIRMYREAKGWSIAELAAKLGISNSAVYRYEVGQQAHTVEFLDRVAAVFGIYTPELISPFIRPEMGADAEFILAMYRGLDPVHQSVAREAFTWLRAVQDSPTDEHVVSAIPVGQLRRFFMMQAYKLPEPDDDMKEFEED